MQHDVSLQNSALAFAQQVDEMFAAAEERAKPALARGCTNVRAPIIGIRYDCWFEHEVEQAKRWACAALAAAARFKREHPTWPPLPLRYDEVGRLPRIPPARTILLHSYAVSQSYHRWPQQHPCFRDYAQSALADEYSSPDRVRFDPTLHAEFPPAPGVKLFSWGGSEGAPFLVWYSDNMIARDEAVERLKKVLGSPVSTREQIAEARREAARLRQQLRPS